MYVADFESPDDLLEFVRAAAQHLGELGFEDAERALSDWATCSYTTSSEFLGQLGLVCKRIIERDGHRVPPCLREDLDRCLEAGRLTMR